MIVKSVDCRQIFALIAMIDRNNFAQPNGLEALLEQAPDTQTRKPQE